MKKREIINEEIEQIDLYDLSGSIDDAINFLKKCKEKYPEASLSCETEYGYDNDTREFLSVRVKRFETDDEYNDRILTIKNSKEDRIRRLKEEAKILGLNISE